MERVAYALMQDRLSTAGSFILCDGMAEGFPIRYASRGFVDLFSYNAAECIGEKCGALVAAQSITSTDIEKASAACGLSATDVRTAIGVHTEQIIQECRQIMAKKGQHISFSLALNRTKTGRLFVCEILMLAMEHPVVGWPYTIGLQRDVTRQVSVKELLQATSREALAALIERQEGPVKERIESLRLNTDATNGYFHSKSVDMWEDMMRMVMASKGDLKVQDLSSGSVTLSTADGTSWEDEASSGYDVASTVADALPVCLHVKNLSSNTTRAQLGYLFESYGPVVDVEVEQPTETGAPCVGFVVLGSAEGAARAVAELAGESWYGSCISVAVGAIAGQPAGTLGMSLIKVATQLCCGSAWPSILRFEKLWMPGLRTRGPI
mmetsp:Transcript_86185/g.257255  ORF Transcript_86185/g.257255 Transcript_86185/m.257255 type:complete len:381 (+) Transcript_86185:136-1278(+)